MITKIVIEGPNNVGKTTLISTLLDDDYFTNWSVEHVTEKSPNTLEFYDATLRNCDFTIFDRHCVGELVYPNLFDREPNVTFEDVKRLITSHDDTLFVFLNADLNFINRAYRLKGEEPNWYFITEEIRNRDIGGCDDRNSGKTDAPDRMYSDS